MLDPELNTVRRTGSFSTGDRRNAEGECGRKSGLAMCPSTSGISMRYGDAKEQRSFLDQTLSHDFTTFRCERCEGGECSGSQQGFDDDV